MIYFYEFACLSLTLIFLTSGFSLFPLILLIFIIAFAFKKERKYIYNLSVTFIVGLVLFFSVKKSFEGEISSVGMVVKAENNYLIIKTIQSSFYIEQNNFDLEVGDFIRVSGEYQKLKFFHYQESFGFEKYLNSYGVFSSISKAKIEVLFKTPFRMRKFKNYLLDDFSPEAKAIIGSMLFKDSASKSQSYSIASELGIGYLLTSSNIHISFLFYEIHKIGSRKFNQEKLNKTCAVFLLIIFIFSEYSISIERILIMYILARPNLLKIHLELNYVERISIAGIIILTFHPFYVLNIGFYYIFPTLILFSFISNTIPKRSRYKRVKIAFIFFILTLPFQAILNHTLNVTALFFQIVSAPVFSVIYLFDLLVFIGPISRPFLEMLNSVVFGFLSNLSGFTLIVPIGDFNYLLACLYFLIVVCFTLFEELRFKKCRNASVVCFIFFLALSFSPNINCYYEVHFIDVGQGDSTLIRYKKKNILIDTGGSIYVDLATECLIPYFNRLKINKLDAVLTTHEDYDHVGALDSLEKNFKIDRINRGGNEFNMKFDDFFIEDINTFKDWNNSDTNYTSAVYYFSIFNTSFLIMGDAPIETEKKLMRKYPNLKCDVLKVGHHGSNTSSCIEFLSQVDPEIAVISCGYNNLYGHPKQEVISNLKSLDIPYVRTDIASTYIYKLGA